MPNVKELLLGTMLRPAGLEIVKVEAGCNMHRKRAVKLCCESFIAPCVLFIRNMFLGNDSMR